MKSEDQLAEVVSTLLRGIEVDQAPDDWESLTGFGYSGAGVWRVALGSGEAADSVIVKSWIAETADACREVFFYQEIGPECGLTVPRCYFAGSGLGKQNRSVLVLEDLRESIQADCLLHLSREQAMDFAGDLANMHAKWWGGEALDRYVWLVLASTRYFEDGWLQNRRPTLWERYAGMLGPLSSSLVQNAEKVSEGALQRLAEMPEVLVHGDLHLDNVLLLQRGGFAVLDWERVGRGPYILELADLLFEIAALEDIDDCLSAYHAGLDESGIKISRDDLMRDLELGFLVKFLRSSFGIANWQATEPRQIAIVETGFRRLEMALEWWQGRGSVLAVD